MNDLYEVPDADPYFEEEYMAEGYLIRKTKSETDWMRFQAGKHVIERRGYFARAMHGRGFDEDVVLFHLLGFGKTEEEAISMANNRK